MRFRITEPTFFLHQDRTVGEIMEAPVGPYRMVATGGGLQRIAQFVEMPDQIKEIIEVATTDAGNVASILPVPAPSPIEQPTKPANSSFAEATAAVLKPSTAAPAPISKTAGILSALASRRRKLEETIIKEATDYGRELSAFETDAPAVFVKAKESLADRKASLGELSESLKDFAGSNTDPLSE